MMVILHLVTQHLDDKMHEPVYADLGKHQVDRSR